MNLYKKTPDSLAQASSGNGAKATAPTALASSQFNLPFFHYLTIPKNTTQINPLIYNFHLPIGMINKLWMGFPRGCAGLAGIQIFRGVTQVFPLPAGVWLALDDVVIPFLFSHDMTTEPYFLELRGYNDDDTYQHKIFHAFEMSGKQSDIPPQLAGLINYLKG